MLQKKHLTKDSVVAVTLSEIVVQFLDITYVSTKETNLIGRISDVVRLGRGSDFFT